MFSQLLKPTGTPSSETPTVKPLEITQLDYQFGGGSAINTPNVFNCDKDGMYVFLCALSSQSATFTPTCTSSDLLYDSGIVKADTNSYQEVFVYNMQAGDSFRYIHTGETSNDRSYLFAVWKIDNKEIPTNGKYDYKIEGNNTTLTITGQGIIIGYMITSNSSPAFTKTGTYVDVINSTGQTSTRYNLLSVYTVDEGSYCTLTGQAAGGYGRVGLQTINFYNL